MSKKTDKKIEKVAARPIGRPSKYKTEFCDMLIEHMKSGMSYQTFAAKANCSIECLYEWERTYPDFSDAKRQAFDLNREFWEKVAIEATTGVNPDANATLIIFNLKNRFPKEWRDRQEVHSEINQKIEVSTVDVSERVKRIKGQE